MIGYDVHTEHGVVPLPPPTTEIDCSLDACGGADKHLN